MQWSQPFVPPPVREIIDRTGKLNGTEYDVDLDME